MLHEWLTETCKSTFYQSPQQKKKKKSFIPMNKVAASAHLEDWRNEASDRERAPCSSRETPLLPVKNIKVLIKQINSIFFPSFSTAGRLGALVLTSHFVQFILTI